MTKWIYDLVCITSYLQKIILNELKELAFSFRFDETTTSQVKRQYGVYATYQSVHLTDNNIFFGYIVCWDMHCGRFITAHFRLVN